MPAFTIHKLTPTEFEETFKRQGSNIELLTDYVDNLRGLSVGEGFTMKVSEVERDEKLIEIVPDTMDGQGEVDTVRAFKRRMNAAAESLGFDLKWKPKGHRVGEGEDARFVTDWLSAQVVALSETKKDNGTSSGK